MITDFKLYEMNDGKPEVGDYVICSGTYTANKKFGEYVSHSIGIFKNRINKTIRIDYEYNQNFGEMYLCDFDDILYWSKDKKELEEILIAKKFNI